MASQPPSNPYQFESQTPYATATQTQHLEKPKAIKVFGILNVIFGGLGLLGTCLVIAAILALITFDIISISEEIEPTFVTQDENAFLYFYNITSGTCNLIITIVLFVSGIGLLKQKKWGRTAGLTWAGYSFLATIVALVVTWTHIYPYSLKSISLDDPNAKARMLGELIFSNVFSLGFLIYPGLFALFSSKQPFKDALD